MGSRRTKPRFLIIQAEILGSIDNNRVLDLDSAPAESLLDELQCPPFDDVLVALRRTFSLTFPRNPFIDGLKEALREIRRIGVEALQPIPEVLEELKLKPVPPPSEETYSTKVYVFQYSLARMDNLPSKVMYEDKPQRFIDLIEQRSADEVVRALRDVVSVTFEEMHSENQHEEVLRRIRRRIAAILPPLNDILVSIEIEPVAEPEQIEAVCKLQESYEEE